MTTTESSIILIGNTGVGKSFAVNCLLNEEIFESEERSVAVTSKLEFKKNKNRGYNL